MAGMKGMEPGTIVLRAGNVTQLKAIPFGNSASVEKSLGYGEGRLTEGYSILVLKEKLVGGIGRDGLEDARHFEFDGTTMRSGGKLGLPAATAAADALRPRVLDDILKDRSQEEYLRWKMAVAAGMPLDGPDRLVKVAPMTPHAEDMAPDRQYPMGGGGLQWLILKTRPLKFLVAVFIDEAGMAHTPDFAVQVFGEGQFLEERMKLRRYLETA